MLNSVLMTSAGKVMSSTSPASFTITAHFISAAAGSKFSFYPILIDEIQLNQNFAQNFADELDLAMTISPKDYALLHDQGQDLLCVLTITYCDKYGKEVFTPPPIQKQYHAMINNARDIRKALPDVHVYTEMSTPISIRLIEPTVYALRHTKINAVYPAVTVKQAIYAITQAFGIERLHLVEPDNDHVYDHVSFGSYQNISSIYNYLQSVCGVYTKGINAYIQNECMYIYPPFETDPTYDKSTLFYQVDSGRYAGNDVFHRYENSTLSIVVNTQPHSYDLSIAGSENIGTGFVFNRASRLADGFTTIDSAQGAQYTQDPAFTVTLKNSRTASKDKNNLFHIHATDNPFPAMSELISHQASLMDVQWMNADPFIMDPCQKIVYYYDKNGTMIQKTGIMEKAAYRMVRLKQTDARSVFSCVGVITLRLSPNETVVL